MDCFKGKKPRTPPYVMEKSMVSCRFPLKPIHFLIAWFLQNQGYSRYFVLKMRTNHASLVPQKWTIVTFYWWNNVQILRAGHPWCLFFVLWSCPDPNLRWFLNHNYWRSGLVLEVLAVSIKLPYFSVSVFRLGLHSFGAFSAPQSPFCWGSGPS